MYVAMSSSPKRSPGMTGRLAALAMEATPQLFAIAVFASGTLTLISAVTPEFESRLTVLDGVLAEYAGRPAPDLSDEVRAAVELLGDPTPRVVPTVPHPLHGS